ncbi:MAG: PRTRC system ThiF family protein [Bacteroidota bacterium]|nr:PRTRC system ThiF family protein [Bacteroidota bacterium]
MKSITKTHYTAAELINPQHPVTVALVGVGGTGSQVLNNLARIHSSLRSLSHPGLHVTAYDSDVITEANLGRQLFSRAELGMNKANALVTRINRFYGNTWDAVPLNYNTKNSSAGQNILITCVDNVSIRKDIGKFFDENGPHSNKYRPEIKNYYWMDFGNSRNSGQVVLGTYGIIKQPKKVKGTSDKLPTITTMFPDLERHEKADQGPSCSLAEALIKQDLFINSTLAQFGCNILWKMFRELRIQYHGGFINLENWNTNPIKIK